MFPTTQDVEQCEAKFGAGATIKRLQIQNLACYGTQFCAVITPAASKEATLVRAWDLARNISHWILAHADGLPATERYCVIVGRSVRQHQGQIFKICGERSVIAAAADAGNWTQNGYAPLLHWEEEVFSKETP